MYIGVSARVGSALDCFLYAGIVRADLPGGGEGAVAVVWGTRRGVTAHGNGKGWVGKRSTDSYPALMLSAPAQAFFCLQQRFSVLYNP